MHALSTDLQKPHSNNSSQKKQDELRLSKESGRGHNLWGLYGALDLDICAKMCQVLSLLQGQLEEDLGNGHSCFCHQGRWPEARLGLNTYSFKILLVTTSIPKHMITYQYVYTPQDDRTLRYIELHCIILALIEYVGVPSCNIAFQALHYIKTNPRTNQLTNKTNQPKQLHKQNPCIHSVA